VLGQYYRLNREALPNWFFFFLESRALSFLAIPLAEKVLLTAYVVLFPVSVRYALRAIDRQASFLAVLAFPFVYKLHVPHGVLQLLLQPAGLLPGARLLAAPTAGDGSTAHGPRSPRWSSGSTSAIR